MPRLILNLSIEFGPIIGFLFAAELTTFIKATLIFVVLTAAALIIGYIDRKEIAWFPLIAGISIIAFGLLTIIFLDPFFIIIKDTVYNGFFAVALFIGLFQGKALLKPLFSGLFSMSDIGWKILTFRWAVMFTLLAGSNEIVRALVPPEKWVIYKGIATLTTIVFALYQFRLSRKERLDGSTPWGMRMFQKR